MRRTSSFCTGSARSTWPRTRVLETLIAGQRNPRVLADLARARMKLKHTDLVQGSDRPVR